jgi:uncharacterized protein (DUF1501 family)
MTLARRDFLAAAALLGASPVLLAQAATERRFVLVLQRGAADGLNTVVPYADPDYARHRGALAIDASEALKLDGSFALHPSLTHLHGLYGAGEATVFHAVASPYRDRSHFDGQNVLETGGTVPYRVRDGWMNRLMGMLPRHGKQAMAFSPAVPMALRGALDVSTYAPSALPQANDDLMQRVEMLYAQDAQLHGLWSSALEARGMAGGSGNSNRRLDPVAQGRMSASFLARADGPRVAMIESNGWDTHSGQNGRLTSQLKGLDGLLAGLHEGLGAAWSQTVVLVATEFGRTVAANGTGGTDHGTGSAAMLLGGAVQGGRIVADWPGLASGNLHEGRDLKPTLGLDSLVTAVCAEAFGLDPVRAGRVLFPESTTARFKQPLLRA